MAEDKQISDLIGGTTYALFNAIKENPAVLHEVGWRDLERLIADLLTSFGWNVTMMPPTRESGVDLSRTARFLSSAYTRHFDSRLKCLIYNVVLHHTENNR